MPSALASWTGLKTLDLSWNPLQLVSDDGAGGDASALFTEEHRLTLLGLRQSKGADDAWPHKDVHAVARIQRNCQKSMEIICWAELSCCQLDIETRDLSDLVN